MFTKGNKLLYRATKLRAWVPLCLGFVPAVLAWIGPSASFAQFNIPRESTSGVFLPSNRLDTRGIQQAQELISKGEYSQAIRFLDKILARSEDSFVTGPDDEHDGQKYYGLKETARQTLRGLPPEGHRIYETTFGPVARRLLKQATANGDQQQLRQIAQRYFYTPAGYEAALLFAQNESDEGRHLAAALTYQQLLDTPESAARFQPQLSVFAAISWLSADNPARAAEVLEELAQQGYREIQLSGRDYPMLVSQNGPSLSSQNGFVDWLYQAVGRPVIRDLVAENQWLTARGNPSRNGQTDGGLPHLRVRWQVRLLEHHRLESVHEQMAGLLARQKKSRLPAATPLAVGDYVITRSAHGLIAIDFKTGKRIWQAQPQRASMLQSLLEVNGHSNENSIEPAQTFARMIWEDYLYNTTSSDGKHVYVIRDLTSPKLDRIRSLRFMQRNPREGRNDETNRLCAYDLPTQGKLVWEIDGAARNDELQGAFFLGAPLTVGQSLYCLAEIKSETAIYLVVLDRSTGELRWRQQLADLETGISHDIQRRLQASMPSYDAGMLICPTGAGVVVGVDLAKQALAWAYRYRPAGHPTARLRIQRSYGVARPQWVHSAPVIAGGRVLLTPSGSDQLHCLDLLTGKLLWKQPRGDSLFLAGVEDGHVLLVGNRKMSAVRLADGKSAWPKESFDFPEDGTPTGSGFFSKGQYFLPLSSAQVIAVDIATGKMVAKASSRDGQLLGNLICHRGAVISQTGRFLDCFEQVDVLRAESERRRAEDPTDFEALRILGEIAYNDGQLDRAVKLLREAYESEPADLRTREVLSEALIAALDEEFGQYRSLLPLLNEIQQETLEAQLTLMRLQVKGLQELGQVSEAFEVCLKVYNLVSPFSRISNGNVGARLETDLSIGHERKVTALRWLAAQVGSAWASASRDQREQIAEQFLPLLEQILQVHDTNRRRQFYDCFGSIEQAEVLGIELVADYLEQGELLAAQQLLLNLSESETPSVRHAAIASSSRLFHEAKMPLFAAPYDHELRGPLAQQECLPGLTGSDCLIKWASSSEKTSPSWPHGRVELTVQELKAGGGSKAIGSKRNRSPQTGITLERSDEVLGNCNVTLLGMISGRNRAITIRDSFGRVFFQAKLDHGTQRRTNSQGSVYGVSRGNLLILSMGRQIVAYDTLSSSNEPLWRKDTMSNLHHFNQYRLGHRNMRLRGRNDRHRSGRTQSDGNWLGLIGPLTQDSCVFQVEERLLCVDSQTGDVRWSRDNIPLGSDLFGDDQYTFVVPKDSDQAIVLSTIDGRSLGKSDQKVPAWKERLATVGRQVIRWRRRTDWLWELSAVDSLDGEVLWEYEFEKNTQVDVVQNRFVVTAEPTGHCSIVDITDGRLVVDQPIDVNRSLEKVYLLAGTKNFVVAVQQQHEIDRERVVTSFNRTDFPSITSFAGQVYLFDRETGLAVWDRPAEVKGLPFMLTQPIDLPTIAFAGNIRRRDKSGTKPEMGIMLLEKASGRMLFHREDLPQSPHNFLMRASDLELNEMVVEMNSRKIRLKFTDRPRAPEPPASHKVQRKVETGRKGLQKIGENFFPWRIRTDGG